MPGKWIWEPTEEWIRGTNVFGLMQSMGAGTAGEFIRQTQDHPAAFWDLITRETGIEWFRPFDRIVDDSRGPEWCRWFIGGKLNIAWNCAERHARGPYANKLACIWEGEDGSTRSITFAGMAEEAGRVAGALRELGLREGDRVALCMPMIPEVAFILYGCFQLGVIVVPIFAGFGPGAIATRLADSGARVVFTADYQQRRGKLLPLKEKVDEAIEKVPAVEKVVVLTYKGGSVPWNTARDLEWKLFLRPDAQPVRSQPLDSETPALIIYTSGTTGKPKGTVHTHAAALAQMSKEIYLGFDHKAEDRFFWLSDIGWMMGPWTLIGNHHFGGTVFLYDGAPDYPGPDRLWEMIARHRITTFGISPTAIRLLMTKGAEVPARHDLSSLRLLGSTGEPWDDKSYEWYFENIGRRRCPIINISGGTEIVGSFLSPLPIQPLKPCSLGGPAPGMATDVFDEHGKPVRGRMGYLVCTKPAPSMTRGIWGDPNRYIETYWSRWPGVWYHGDFASVDEDGCWFVHGRADESMNVAGRKVGPAEVEEALMEHPAVSEAAVIGVPDELKGEAIVGFVVLQAGVKPGAGLLKEIEACVEKSLGATLRPRSIHTVAELPKTQSGKVVRRLIRQSYLGEALGDLSTVANAAALESFKARTGTGD